MRRALAILLVLFFGLGPLTPTLEGDDDARLPACCRRHGAHHCAMGMRMAAIMAEAASGSTPSVTAPLTCPLFPGFDAVPVVPAHALTAAAVPLPLLVEQTLFSLDYCTARRMRPALTRAGRGPPASSLA